MTLYGYFTKINVQIRLFDAYLLKVERLSIDPESKGAIKPGSGKPLWDGKGDGGLQYG